MISSCSERKRKKNSSRTYSFGGEEGDPLNTWVVASSRETSLFLTLSSQDSSDWDQANEHWSWWPFSANAFPPCHLLRTGTAFLRQQARLSCHLCCMRRGKGAEFQPGAGERPVLLGLGDWAEMELLPAHLPACFSGQGAARCSAVVWVTWGAGGARSPELRHEQSVGPSGNYRAGQSRKRGRRQGRIVMQWEELQPWSVLLVLLFTC